MVIGEVQKNVKNELVCKKMKSKTFFRFFCQLTLDMRKSFFIQNNLTDFEKLSNLSDLDINEIQENLHFVH